MKKITTLLLLCLAALVLIAPAYADETDGLVELYPYNDPGALYGPSTPFTLVGDSFWDVEFLGHNYHIVRGGARFATMFNDANSDGLIQPTEYGALSWNAFAALTINDGPDEITMTTNNARADITSVVQRLYSYFDENGVLQMFEDHIFTYHIVNEGSDVTTNADWRLATEAEITAYTASATPAVDFPNMRVAPIRIIRDAVDTDGYVLEPLTSLTWRNPDLSALPEAEQSLLLDYNPNYVVIPGGWTVISWGTNDRGASNQKTTDWIKTFARSILNPAVEPLVVEYDTQDPVFAGVTALDNDPATPGVQIVVDYQDASFDLSNTVNATWIDMFDDTTGLIINQTKKLSYKVEVFEGEELVETINFAYDSGTDAYTPDKALSVVDVNTFGAAYTAKYSATHPENGTKEVLVDIVVGVIPPRFVGVANRYSDEGVFIDLLDGIIADDGYGNDITDTVEVTVPAGFNYFSPKPGVYTIQLDFTHHVHIPGITAQTTFGAQTFSYVFNPKLAASNAQPVQVYDATGITHIQTNWNTSDQMQFTSEYIVVAANGTVREKLSRANNKLVNAANPLPTTNAGNTNVVDPYVWLDSTVLAPGEYLIVIVGAGANAANVAAKALAFGDPVSVVLGVPAQDHYLPKTATYQLTIDDKTAPNVFVIDEAYTIEADKFSNVDQAILANVVAFDNFDTKAQLEIYVVEYDGMAVASGKLVPGSYDVQVFVDDQAGNSTMVTFTVVVKAAKPTQEEVDQKVDDKADEIETQIPTDTITPEEVQDAIDAALAAQEPGVNVLTAVLMSLGAALLSFGGAALLFFLKKK